MLSVCQSVCLVSCAIICASEVNPAEDLMGSFNSLFFSLGLGFSSVQFSSVPQSCLTLCDPMNRSMPGLPVHHHHPEFPETQVHRLRDATQPSHPWSSPSPPAPNPSQHQGFSSESTLCMRWPKYWSFSFSISPSKEIRRLPKIT